MHPIITLLTDFGREDHYVASVKAVLLSRCPSATVVDITHSLPAHDIAAAAFLLASCWRDFPEGTVHLAVVDPGVGSSRLPLVLSAAHHLFVGPDNGIFTHVVREADAWRAHSISGSVDSDTLMSPTFHARDVFAPAAALLACGDRSVVSLGPAVISPELLDLPEASPEPGCVTAAVAHIDRFGNVISNARAAHLKSADLEIDQIEVSLAGAVVKSFYPYYAAAPPGQPFVLWSSGGYLEVAMSKSPLAETLGVKVGDVIRLARKGALA